MHPERKTQRQNLKGQIEQFRLLAPPSLDQFLFPDGKINLVFLFEGMTPRPLGERKLLILKIDEKMGLRGVFLGISRDWAEEKIENRPLMEEEVEKIKNSGGAVILVDELPSAETGQVFEVLRENLRPESKIWVLEIINEKLDDEEKDARLSFLESFGLVKRKVVGLAGTNFVVWYGRMAKEREKIAVDLTQKPWFRSVLAQTKFFYQTQGWKEIDFEPILKRCQASSFPPRDLRNLRYGFGVNLENYCGCRWETSIMDGSWTRTVNCPEEECPGIPRELPIKKPEPSKKQEKTFLLGFGLETELVCWECGGKLVFDRRIISLRTEKICRVKSDLCCPHCGLVETKILTVRRENIRLGPP